VAHRGIEGHAVGSDAEGPVGHARQRRVTKVRLACGTKRPSVIADRIERIMRRVPRVPQRTANDGRERAITVTRSAEQIPQRVTFYLVTGR